MMAEPKEDVSGWVEVDDSRTVWEIRNYHPWRIRLIINRPPGPQRYSEFFGEIPPMFDVEISGGQKVRLTLTEPYEGDWVAEAERV